MSKQHFRREKKDAVTEAADNGGKKLEIDGRAGKKNNTQLDNGTYRILADLHYCGQTVKRSNTEKIITAGQLLGTD